VDISWTINWSPSGNRKESEVEIGAGKVKSESVDEDSIRSIASSSWWSLVTEVWVELDEHKKDFNSETWSETLDIILRQTKSDIAWADHTRVHNIGQNHQNTMVYNIQPILRDAEKSWFFSSIALKFEFKINVFWNYYVHVLRTYSSILVIDQLFLEFLTTSYSVPHLILEPWHITSQNHQLFLFLSAARPEHNKVYNIII